MRVERGVISVERMIITILGATRRVDKSAIAPDAYGGAGCSGSDGGGCGGAGPSTIADGASATSGGTGNPSSSENKAQYSRRTRRGGL